GRRRPIRPLVDDGAPRRIGLPEPTRAVFGRKIADDGMALPNDEIAVFKGRHFAIGIEGAVLLGVEPTELATHLDMVVLEVEFGERPRHLLHVAGASPAPEGDCHAVLRCAGPAQLLSAPR